MCLAGNQIHHLLVYRTVLNQLSQTGQGCISFFWCYFHYTSNSNIPRQENILYVYYAQTICNMAPETRETRAEKVSFPTGLLSSFFSVVLPQRALTPSTATRRWKIPKELCLFSSLSTIPTASVAFLTRVIPCSKRERVAYSPACL